MKSSETIILAAIIAAGLPALAPAVTYTTESYLVDSAGTIVKSGTGLCWHTNYWMPLMAVEGCDPIVIAVKDEIKPLPNVKAIQPPLPTQPAPVHAIVLPMKFTYYDVDHFNFNESELSQKDKAKLDALARNLAGTKYETIHVTGYTDRIGKSEYNQKLSMRRADEVKGYLVSQGIPVDNVKAEGKGVAQSITHSTDCKGMKKAEEIVCLQPDRRVEVTVDVTK
jgi:OOP family OmpA-OmpF porin